MPNRSRYDASRGKTARRRGSPSANVAMASVPRQSLLTPLRRRILDLIAAAKEPVKAYELLNRLRAERPTAVPATVYRSLDFLEAHGFVHKLATSRRYMLCQHPGDLHQATFLVCERCGGVTEVGVDLTSLDNVPEVDRLGFRVSASSIEIPGLCGPCSRQGARARAR